MYTKHDWIIFISIYSVAFAIMLHFNLTHPIINDGVYEYGDYLLDIKQGWLYRLSSTNSCLMSTWIPAMIQRYTGWNVTMVFRAFPSFWYALMPAFVYLIARRYLDSKYSVLASLVIISSSYILFFPDVGRVGIALGCMAGLVWALLSHKLIWAITFAVLVVFSHYGTGIIVIGLVGAVLGLNILRIIFRGAWLHNGAKIYAVCLLILVVATGVWHFGIARYSGDRMFSTIFQPERAKAIEGPDWGNFDITKIQDRDTVTQSALGVNFLNQPMPTKIEIIANWLIVAFITLGLYLMLRNRTVDSEFKIYGLVLYGLILATIAIPELSIYYGVQRVYFTASIILAICFPMGIKYLAKIIQIPSLALASCVLLLYAVSTSGLIYLPFGLAKSIPIIAYYGGS